MRKPEQTPEPSIEEILASIRRIIADDAPAAAVTNPGEHIARPMLSAGARMGPVEQTARPAEDDVLELTEDFMLAEEGAALSLHEADEPRELSGDPYAARIDDDFYRDPYSEPSVPQQRGHNMLAEAHDSSGDSGGIFSAVMAEVQRFTAGGSNAQQHAPAQANTPANVPDTWGQPDLGALTPSPPPRPPSRQVWSQRHAEGDGPKPAEEAAATGRPAPSDPRKPSFSNRDNWSQGVQMPVPDAGPATPFPTDEPVQQSRPAAAPPLQRAPEAELRLPASAAGPSVSQAMEDAAASPAPSRMSAPGGVQSMAQELAERAVADFASDRLSTPPAAEILKADKPFMDAITSTLADALARGGDEADDFDDAPPPEDIVEDSFGAGRAATDFRAPPATSPALSKLDRAAAPDRRAMPMPNITNLDGAFVSSRSAAAKDAEPIGADQETPELPREDIDDIVPLPVERSESPAYRPTGIAEPIMQQVPVATTGAPTARSVSGAEAPRESVATAERIQPVPASSAKALEDIVREMLKPLLIQWLDENMPRIVNDAIREEIAANGLLPRAGGSRR